MTETETPDIRDELNALAESHEIKIQRSRQVYCNRDVNLDNVDAIGFDMDYTLALYVQEEMDKLSVQKTLERLVQVKGYPESIFDIEPHPDFAIRGLIIDKPSGNILKIDAGRHIVKAYHGFEPVTDFAKYGYNQQPIRIDNGRYHLIDTLYALPEAFTYAALVDHLGRRQHLDDFVKLFDDIRSCIDLAHSDGSLKSAILGDLPRFVYKDPRLAATLHKFRSTGKKLFLLTNSYWKYTNKVMDFLLGGELDHYPSWRHYFDYVITGASKPGFFTKDAPFLELDLDGNVIGEATDGLMRNRVYQGGNLRDFEANTPASGNRVIYIGDHIYGDILKSKKSSFWSTCFVIQELSAELRQADLLREELTRAHALEVELLRLNEEITYQQHWMRDVDPRLDGDDPLPEELDIARRRVRVVNDKMAKRRRELTNQLKAMEKEIEHHFNPYWGRIFKTRNELSIFGSQVDLFADLYTSTVTNFLSYSPVHYFHAPRPYMPHEY